MAVLRIKIGSAGEWDSCQNLTQGSILLKDSINKKLKWKFFEREYINILGKTEGKG